MIHVLDELRVVPGSLSHVRDLVREIYEPALTELGMALEHSWITPAVELFDEPTDLVLLWTVANTPAFWHARRGTMTDPRVAEFWDAAAPMLAGRNRRIMVDAAQAGDVQ